MIARPLLTVLAAGALFLSAAEDRMSVWKGVYTAAQASRGKALYAEACSRCHAPDLSGYRGVLRGDRFMEQWREDDLKSLFARVKTMPPNAPSSLKNAEYLDIVAYLLQANSFPAGANELDEKSLARIRVEGRSGPDRVPDFSLIETVGCLARDSAGAWLVSQSTEPVRTRNPYKSSVEELKTASLQPPGRYAFQFLDGSTVPAGLPDRGRVKVKGFLIRRTDRDRVNVTSVELLGGDCAP